MNDADPWCAWDGRCLHWHAPAAGELRLDGVRFEPIAAGAGARDFTLAPGGQALLEFSLHANDGAALAPVWRVRYGERAEPNVPAWQGQTPALQALSCATLPPADAMQARVAIVVPVYNSPQSVQRCLAALVRWTGTRAHLILIDDASTDAAIAPMLARYARRANITVLRNEKNLGYTATCNRGIALAGRDDVVLLNADTQVGPRWLERLRLVAHADAATGTVTAVSDNAGAFSVPELEHACPIPARWTLAQTQRALLQNCGGCLPQLPTGNGFCMFVKRALFERVGVLDAAAFPAGYGEENDLCQRAEQVGFRHLIAGDVLVQHERSASFGHERRAALGAQGMAVLRKRYPDYEAKVGASLFGFMRRVLDWRVRRLYAANDGRYGAQPPRPRVLLAGASDERIAALQAELVDRYEFCAQPPDVADARAWLVREAIELVHMPSMDAPLRVAAASVGVPVLHARADTPELAAHYRACWRAQAAFAWDAAADALG